MKQPAEVNSPGRVCLIRHGYFPQDSRVRKEVSVLLEAHIDVIIICLRDDGELPFEEWKGARVYRQPVQHIRGNILRYLYEYFSFFFCAFLAVTRLHLSKAFHVVQVNTMPDFLVFAGILPKLTGAKVILDMHELMPEFFRTKFKFRFSSFFVAVITFVERLSMNFADVVILPSEVRKDLIIRRGCNPEKIVLIYNTPEEEVFQEITNAENNEGDIDVIAHGTIIEMYGYQVLLKATSILRKSKPDIRIAIVGGGEYLPTLQKMSIQLGLENNVIFTGRLPIELVARNIQRAKIGVIPIIKDEFTELAAPNKLFEYIAMRRPVICTDVLGIREYVSDGEVVFFQSENEVELAEKIIKLLNNTAVRRQLVETAMQAYEKIRWNKIKIGYRDLVLESVKKRNPLPWT
jgi:glycosyltransferase involved in cell wall biosynthesis